MNSFGRLFKLNIFGESHGDSIGITIDGCPAGVSLTNKDFEKDLSRRKGGDRGTTSRKEPDIQKIISGVFNKKTTGSPITIIFENTNVQSEDYNFNETPRPGHADFVAKKKFGNYNDFRGGGHFSGRLSLGLVAAGVIAKKIIHPVKIKALIEEAGGKKEIDNAVNNAIKANDSIGGIIECEVRNMPVGLGEPFFDSIESLISHAVFSIPGIKGIEFGSGFMSAKMKGSEHNDLFIDTNGKTATNFAGGINGGISNGNNLFFRVAVKPTSSIYQKQKTINLRTGKTQDLIIKGRHDVCFALRLPVVIEAVTAFVLADLLLIEQGIS
ncbi:MAG: chorismate synthase [Bacteroidales bacterium]|nr:chorismate synthase [Bacteroidales bacterium]